MSTVAERRADSSMILVTALQAVTSVLVCYLVYQYQTDEKRPAVEKEEKEIEESKSEAPVEKRSIRGVNIYGPYKKVRRTVPSIDKVVENNHLTLSLAFGIGSTSEHTEHFDPLGESS